nr:MAG TPA: hypothetical protein [Caudoviricetes sp.]
MQIRMQTGNCKQVHIQTTIKVFPLQRLIRV